MVGARNSPNTNTSEHTAAKALYRAVVAPLLTVVLSLAPAAGPVTTVGRAGAMLYGSSNSASEGFADALAGEKKKISDP